MIQEDLCAHQTVHPGFGNVERMTEEVHGAVAGRSTNIDDAAFGFGVEVQFPMFRERLAWRRVFPPSGVALQERRHEALRLGAQLSEGAEMKATPHFCAPASIKTFDAILEARLTRGRKDRHDAQTETTADDAADASGMLMRALKAGVVIELSEVGETPGTPMLKHGFHRGNRADARTGPGAWQRAEEGDDVEDLHQRPVLDGQVFEQVKAVEFGMAGGQIGEIPARRRGRVAATPVGIEDSMADQHTVNGAHGRAGPDTQATQFAVNGGRPVFAQVTAILEFFPQVQDQCFEFGFEALRDSRIAGWPVREVHAVQAPGAGTRTPALNGAQADTEVSCNLPLRKATTDKGNHRSANLFGWDFCFMFTPLIGLKRVDDDLGLMALN